jgi:RNA polymerase sigma factor (TIGR02999 family)
MPETVPDDLTRVINDLDSRDRHAMAELLPLVYADLRRLADSFFGHERADHTLQPTALVHEAYLRLADSAGGPYENRAHFFRAAAITMRHILLQHARNRVRQKRGGGVQRVGLSEDLAVTGDGGVDLLELNDALEKLARLDARQAQIVELRYFTGLSVAEVAEILDVSKRTIEDDWTLAKAWLWREMRD